MPDPTVLGSLHTNSADPALVSKLTMEQQLHENYHRRCCLLLPGGHYAQNSFWKPLYPPTGESWRSSQMWSTYKRKPKSYWGLRTHLVSAYVNIEKCTYTAHLKVHIGYHYRQGVPAGVDYPLNNVWLVTVSFPWPLTSRHELTIATSFGSTTLSALALMS